MIIKSDIKKHVVDLMKQWLSHRKINKQTGVPISTMSYWRKEAWLGKGKDEDTDMTQLDKTLTKLRKKWYIINADVDNRLTHKPRNLQPYTKWDKDNVLVISDLHSPYDLDDYLSFCRYNQERFRCGTVVFIWDIIDFQSISYHEKLPEELNPKWELALARQRLQDWYKTFPKAIVCMGNHDLLPYRNAKTAGLMREFIKNENEIFEAPDGYTFLNEIELNDVIYTHWTQWDAFTKCVAEGKSLVQWHLHTKAWVQWHRNRNGQIFGMQVGTGIDFNRRTFDYARTSAFKPVLGCWVVLDAGKLPLFISME